MSFSPSAPSPSPSAGAVPLSSPSLVHVQPGPAYQSMDSPSPQSGGASRVHPNDSHLRNDVSCGTLCCPSGLSCFLCTMCCPCTLCLQTCQQVDVRQELVLLSYGRFVGVLREPGCYCSNPCGRDSKFISTKVESTDLPALKVIDKRGNPLRVSGVVNWSVSDSRRAALEVDNYRTFLKNQAEVAMKQICSNYPYESKHVAAGSVAEDCLKTEGDRIRLEVVALLQSKVGEAGLLIRDYQFNEISYAPEIASQMLVRQQAEAMLDARKVVVEGAVAIAGEAIVRLKDNGLVMPPAEANRLAANLIITICSESRVTPTINLATDNGTNNHGTTYGN